MARHLDVTHSAARRTTAARIGGPCSRSTAISSASSNPDASSAASRRAFLCTRCRQSDLDRECRDIGPRERAHPAPVHQHGDVVAAQRVLQLAAGAVGRRPHAVGPAAPVHLDQGELPDPQPGSPRARSFVTRVVLLPARRYIERATDHPPARRQVPPLGRRVTGLAAGGGRAAALLRSAAGYHAFRRVHRRGLMLVDVVGFLRCTTPSRARSTTASTRGSLPSRAAPAPPPAWRAEALESLDEIRRPARAIADAILQSRLHDIIDWIQKQLTRSPTC